MSLNGSLQVGRSALVASQAALQVAGSNMANAATKGYHRRTVHLAPMRDEIAGRGHYVGRGVELVAIRREVDTALQARLRDAMSEEHGAIVDQRFLAMIETLQHELSGDDVSSQLSAFFNAFSELANNPEDHAVRAVVIQQGQALAGRISGLRSDYNVVIKEIDRTIGSTLSEINDLLGQLEVVTQQIAESRTGVDESSALLDQRDILIDELSKHLDVTAIEQESGNVDLLVGSVPIFLAGKSRGVELRTQSVGNQVELSIRVAEDGTEIQVSSGALAGLLRQREDTVQPAIDDLDELAGHLIFQVNRLHSQGQGRLGVPSVVGTYTVSDTTANLNSIDAGLPFDIENGSFFIHVTHSDTGARTTHQINVDGNADSLDDLINEINVVVGVPNVTAATGLGNTLTLTAASGFEISFSDDSSGALAALGVNTFFTGSNGGDIDVNQTVVGDPNLLAVGAGHVPGSNGTALAIVNLQNTQLDDLGGQSLRELWHNAVNALAIKTDAANSGVASAQLVRESLEAQVQAVSGVSLDEEALNLLTFQHQFQAAARFISVI
ncbi:MAG: flagellar hook-associated protein FlgK, partial [Planctomycetota bacterium]